jgi:hypothetical protein
MKRFFLLCLIVLAVNAQAQVTVNLQLAPVGLSLKSQLWNMFVTNSSTSGILIHAELRLTEANSNVQVMNATTSAISIIPGNQLLQVNALAPIQYNITDPAYQSFALTEFLPVGQFLACFSIIKHTGDATEKILEECEIIEVEPLGPPQLVYPYHQEAIETQLPIFNWSPPSPMNLFTGMSYDLEVVDVFPNQTETDAIQQNIPLLRQAGISATTFPYPAGAPGLEINKKYAWRILVKTNQAVVARSEVWWFTLKDMVRKDSAAQIELPYAKLKKDNQLSYTIAQNDLKFEYLNETSDIIWNAKVFDISTAKKREVSVSFDSIRLKRGQNQVRIPLLQLDALIDKHLYLLQVENSRGEIWRLKFEYRRKEEQ